MKVVEDVMTRNCLRKDSDLILGNILLVTELLITGTHYLPDCVNCKTINTFKKHLSPALELGAV